MVTIIPFFPENLKGGYTFRKLKFRVLGGRSCDMMMDGHALV